MNNNLRNVHQPKGIRMWISAAVAIAAVLSLLIYMATFILFSFEISFATGLRSLAATVLPFTVLIYLRVFTNFLRHRHQTPLFNLYFIFTVWTVLLFGFGQSLYGLAFPLGELLFSITLSAIAWRYRSQSTKVFLSCCYGVITGSLIYVIFAGSPFIV